MYLKDIDFPNKIIDSIQNHTLVVFAGAGASVDPPTSLPNFEKLAKEIAEGTGYTLKKSDSCEVFLGMLKAQGIPVNEQAAEILSGTCVEHNKLHEAIIDLFPDPTEIKIVTTNYDQMFEHVLSSRGGQTEIYNIPALPLGNDVNGIIHIHGNVDQPKYMIVTDEDFGKAYLTEGYASRFLVQLFETYTVLFVGYSYNDTILRYLTRAMSRNNTRKKYILTDDKKSDWSALGIEPIMFPKRKYATMREGLVKLGLIAKRGLLDWKNQLVEISDAPPKDLTADTEIEYCLESVERTRVLANSVHGNDWIQFLDEKKVFDRCFSETDKLFDSDIIWGNWLCDNYVGKNDDRLIQLMLSHNNCISEEFVGILSNKLIRTEVIDNDVFSKYVVLLERQLNNAWVLSRLIEVANGRNLFCLGFHMFKKLLDSRIILQRGWFSADPYDYRHAFNGSYYEIQHAWDLIGEKVCEETAFSILRFVNEKIEEVHYKYAYVGKASKDTEPWEMAMMIIEEREENSYKEDGLHILAQMYIDATICLREKDQDKLRNYILTTLDSESILLKKIALKAIRVSAVIKPKEAIDILLNKKLLDFVFVKEQVFLLVAQIFNSLDDNDKNILVDAIETMSEDSEDDGNKAYTVYNWCVWLQRIDAKNTRVNSIVSDFHKRYGYEPRKHPELSVESSSAVWSPDKSPVTDEQLMNMQYHDVSLLLRDYYEDPFEGPNRYGLLKVFETCISQDYQWAKGVILELLNNKIKSKDIWQHAFQGVANSEFSLPDVVDLLELLALHTSEMDYDKDLSNLLFSTIRQDELKECFSEYEDRIYSASEVIWSNRSRKKVDCGSVVDMTLNTTIGTVLLAWIYMISYDNEIAIPSKYKEYFEKAIKLRSWERNVSICVLAGHFNFLCYRDKDWCMNNLIPLLISNDKNMFSSAWDGLTYFSSRINKDTIDILSPVYFKAIKHIGWLGDETKCRFVELLLTLLIHAVDKPTLRYIPAFYRSANEAGIILFINAIEHRLKNMSESEKKKWWDNWLKHFLDNRKRNKPVPLSEKENQAILKLLVELDFVFDEAVQTICRGSMPKVVDGLFWFSYHEKKIASRFPHDTAVVITKVLNSSSIASYDNLYVKDIIKDISGLTDKEQKALQEVLLLKDIVVD